MAGSARECQLPLLRKELARAQLETSDVREPHRETERAKQLRDRVAPRVAHPASAAEEPCDIVEDGMCHGLESEGAGALGGRIGGKCREAVVLPPHIVVPVGSVHDAHPALTGKPDEPRIPEQRSEDHLELHGVGGKASQDASRIGRHVNVIGAGLRRAARTAWPGTSQLPYAEARSGGACR